MWPTKDGVRLSMILPDFEESHGISLCLQNDPFLLANSGWGLPKLWVKLRASGGGVETMAKMGNP